MYILTTSPAPVLKRKTSFSGVKHSRGLAAVEHGIKAAPNCACVICVNCECHAAGDTVKKPLFVTPGMPSRFVNMPPYGTCTMYPDGSAKLPLHAGPLTYRSLAEGAVCAS